MKKIFAVLVSIVLLAMTSCGSGGGGGSSSGNEYLNDVKAIAMGDNHSMALKNDGTVWTWGINQSGELGNSNVKFASYVPVQVLGLNDVKTISAGSNFSLALKNDGTVWAWGANYFGQLGDGTTIYRYTPVQVNGLTDVKAISARWSSTALKNDGTVWIWGFDGSAEILTPIQVSGINNVKAIDSILYLKNDGTVWMQPDINKTPEQIAELTDIIAISGDDGTGNALENNGTVWTWGLVGDCLLDQPDNNSLTYYTDIPVKVIMLSKNYDVKPLSDVIAISGSSYRLALKNDGTVWHWGSASDYLPYSCLPIQVNGLTGISAVAVGLHHVSVLKNDGTVWSWGDNSFGQLGDGTRKKRSEPVQVRQ